MAEIANTIQQIRQILATKTMNDVVQILSTNTQWQNGADTGKYIHKFILESPKADVFSLSAFLHLLSTTHLTSDQAADKVFTEKRLNHVTYITSFIDAIIQKIISEHHIPQGERPHSSRDIVFQPTLNETALLIQSVMEDFFQNLATPETADTVRNFALDGIFIEQTHPTTLPPLTPRETKQRTHISDAKRMR